MRQRVVPWACLRERCDWRESGVFCWRGRMWRFRLQATMKDIPMKLHTFSTALLFCLVSMSLAAQGGGSGQTMDARGVQVSRGCPVALQLKQRALSGMQQVGKGQPKVVFETWIHLVLSSTPGAKMHAAEIEAAVVTVHGYDGSPRFELVWPGTNAPAAKSLDVKFAPASEGSVATDFSVKGISTASSLDLNSITFSNGSVWKPAKGSTCTVMPDLFMLIGEETGGRITAR